MLPNKPPRPGLETNRPSLHQSQGGSIHVPAPRHDHPVRPIRHQANRVIRRGCRRLQCRGRRRPTTTDVLEGRYATRHRTHHHHVAIVLDLSPRLTRSHLSGSRNSHPLPVHTVIRTPNRDQDTSGRARPLLHQAPRPIGGPCRRRQPPWYIGQHSGAVGSHRLARQAEYGECHQHSEPKPPNPPHAAEHDGEH